MKKNIKITLILLIPFITLLSCDNDATSGILNNIVNSTVETTYNMRYIARNGDDLYAVEDDGIYKTVNNSATDETDERELILDTSNYSSIENLYFTASNLYFVSYNPTSEEKELYYFDPSVASPTPTQINVADSIYTMTNNGYAVGDDDNYYFKNISDTNDITTGAEPTSPLVSANTSLSSLVPSGDNLFVQVVTYDDSTDTSTYDYYYLAKSSGTISQIATDQDNTIISAVESNVTNEYFCVLDNADLIKIDVTGSNSITTYYDNDSTSYSFNNVTKNFDISDNNYLILLDSSNDVLLYDLSNATNDEGFTVLEEGFANTLSSTSDIVYIEEAHTDVNKYSFYVGTYSNGYYTIEIEDVTQLNNDESDNSTSVEYIKSYL